MFARSTLRTALRAAAGVASVRGLSVATGAAAAPQAAPAWLLWAGVGAVSTAALWSARTDAAAAKAVDYTAVRKAIADILDEEGFDDGSIAPILIRLAWHGSGSYDLASKTGGSNGATIRFAPESEYGANKGLKLAMSRLEAIKAKFPDISYADLYTLAGVVAVEEMGGPTIKWRPGRTDKVATDGCPADGRLPDASKGADHIRDVFYAKGFNDQEIVALIGCHAVGRMHLDRSGFNGIWTRSPTTFSNDFFKVLLNETWGPATNAAGNVQYTNTAKDLVMLPADLAVIKDPEFRKYAELYAKDQDKFFADFAVAYAKLLDLGVTREEAGLLSWARCSS